MFVAKLVLKNCVKWIEKYFTKFETSYEAESSVYLELTTKVVPIV